MHRIPVIIVCAFALFVPASAAMLKPVGEGGSMQEAQTGSGQQAETQRAGSEQPADRQDNMTQTIGQPAATEEAVRPRDTQQTTGTQSRESALGQQSFQQADADRDNRVSRTEAEDTGVDYVVMEFDTIDLNRDGYLDEDEWNDGMATGMEMESDTRVDMEQDESLYLNGDGEIDTRFERSNYAGDDGSVRFEEDFDTYDVNDDGYLDEEEATTDWVDVNLFEKSDVNDDGLVDIGEAEDGFMEWGDENEAEQEQ